MRDIGLQNIDHAHIDQFRVPKGSDQALAGGDWRGGMADGARHRADVFRRADLFGEQQMQRLYFAQNNRGHCRTGPRVKVDRKIQIRPKPLAQHFHVRHGSLDLRIRLHALE